MSVAFEGTERGTGGFEESGCGEWLGVTRLWDDQTPEMRTSHAERIYGEIMLKVQSRRRRRRALRVVGAAVGGVTVLTVVSLLAAMAVAAFARS